MKKTVLIIFLALSKILNAQSNDSIIANLGSTPTINGEISEGEWDDANVITFNNMQGVITVYVKHDSNMLYFAVNIPDNSFYSGDHLVISIDANHNGMNARSDDFLLGNLRDTPCYNNFLQGSTNEGWKLADTTGISCAKHSSADKWVLENGLSFERLGVDNNYPKTLGVKFENWDNDPEGRFYWPESTDGGILADIILIKNEITISTLNNIKNNTLHVFPNPNYGNFQIQFPEMAKEDITMNLYNQIGQKINCDNIKYNDTGGSLLLNISSFKPGIYFLQVTTPQKQFIKKIILQ